MDDGCDYDDSQPLRVSPAKTEIFLLSWLPRKAILDVDEIAVMADVTRAWIRYAAEQTGLPDVGVQETLAAVNAFTDEFSSAMADESRAGPAKTLIKKLQTAGINLTDQSAIQDWVANHQDELVLAP